MSSLVLERTQLLESQNQKLRNLLDATLQLVSDDQTKCAKLRNEAIFLRKTVSELENQKKQLEEELIECVNVNSGNPVELAGTIDIRNNVNAVLNDIQQEITEIQRKKTQDELLMHAINQLEEDKTNLLKDIELVKKTAEEINVLTQDNLRVRQELAVLESQSFLPSYSGSEIVKKILDLETTKEKLLGDIKNASEVKDLLGNPLEPIVLELQLAGLEKQQKKLRKCLIATMLQSANEISTLHINVSDHQLRVLLKLLADGKNILNSSMADLKQMHDYVVNFEAITIKDSIKEDILTSFNQKVTTYVNALADASVPQTSNSFCSTSSEVLQIVNDSQEADKNFSIVMAYEQDHHDLPTVSEEDESKNDPTSEQQQLKEEIKRLERERDVLLIKVQMTNSELLLNGRYPGELHETFMKEESTEEVPRLPLDDATNQMFTNEEQLLIHRIRELEQDNTRIRHELAAMQEVVEKEKEIVNDVLVEGERLIRDHVKDTIINDADKDRQEGV